MFFIELSKIVDWRSLSSDQCEFILKMRLYGRKSLKIIRFDRRRFSAISGLSSKIFVYGSVVFDYFSGYLKVIESLIEE